MGTNQSTENTVVGSNSGTGKIDDEALQKAFMKVKDNLNDKSIMKEAFYSVRDDIYKHVRSCAENVRVEIKFEKVLDNPLVVATGSEENQLLITIETDGKVTYKWTKQTWNKLFVDVKEKVKSVAQCFLSGFLSLFTKKSLSIENKTMLSITASK